MMMNNTYLACICAISVSIFSCSQDKEKTMEKKSFEPPVSYEVAARWADSVVNLMTLEEKIRLISGVDIFYTQDIPRLDIPRVFMADATQGIHLRDSMGKVKYERAMEKSTSFPSPILLASTWNKKLAADYATSIGEECRAGGIPVLLGPGMNIYRISQCGRNFEYFGEDPFLAGQMISNYVTGLQSTGTIATLKHFACNNTDYFRRKSNSVVDERTMHEIYFPAFKAGIDAGAMAVMTSYNLVNGEWAGQSDYLINEKLRDDLGFKWLVMTDWWSVYDGKKVIESGQDLEMPFAIALTEVQKLVEEGQVKESDINRMVSGILKTFYAMKSFNREKESKYLELFDEHEKVALNTAREGIVLLKNNGVLPLENLSGKNILLTGYYVEEIARGGGAATVEGYNNVLLIDALKKEFSDQVHFVKDPSDEEIINADYVLFSGGTYDSEGWDRSFDIPVEQEDRIKKCIGINKNTIVIFNSGSGLNMTNIIDKAAAIVYAWYPGQAGNLALAEILSGKTNPSGKLPVTIEKRFEDSPGYGYIPQGEQLYTDWQGDAEKNHPVYDVVYNEGIFVGYRWYENKKIEPLFPFGFGLSYTSYEYSDLRLSSKKISTDGTIKIKFTLSNTGKREGAEIAQVYVSDIESSLPRPVKELKGFEKVHLRPGEKRQVTIELNAKDFSYWHPTKKDWYAEPGEFKIMVGPSSANIRLEMNVELVE